MAEPKDMKVEDEIEIEIVDGPNELDGDKGAGTEVSVETPAKPDAASSPQAGVEALQKQLAASEARRVQETNARQAAEQRAAQATGAVDESRAAAIRAYELSAKQALEAGENSLKAARQKYISASEAADAGAQADAQIEMAQAVGNINAAKNQISQLEGVKKQMTDAAAAGQRQAGTGRTARDDTRTDVVVEAASKSADWISRNPAFNTDAAFKNKAMSAHYRALAEGIPAESDEYFQFLDKAVNPAREVEVTRTPARPAAGTTAAAPSRSSQPAKESNPTRIRLTPAQVEAAEMSGQTPKQYAANLIALQNEGKMARTN